MPDFRKSYKKSKNSKNSKSGGRRRKHTMRKYRRGKKVMGGGVVVPSNPNLTKKMSELFEKKVFDMIVVEQFIKDNSLPSPDDISNMTYLELQRHVSSNDTSVDEPTTLRKFNEKFKLPNDAV